MFLSNNNNNNNNNNQNNQNNNNNKLFLWLCNKGVQQYCDYMSYTITQSVCAGRRS